MVKTNIVTAVAIAHRRSSLSVDANVCVFIGIDVFNSGSMLLRRLENFSDEIDYSEEYDDSHCVYYFLFSV